jgi:hypothetical protein
MREDPTFTTLLMWDEFRAVEWDARFRASFLSNGKFDYDPASAARYVHRVFRP